MKDIIMFGLAAIGASAILAVVFGLVIVVYFEILEFIEDKKREYRIKHRFDKPPTAECYCIDCVKWNKDRGTCYKFNGWGTADNWFCWDAEPRKKVD